MNPRRGKGRRRLRHKGLLGKRYLAEQLHSPVKGPLLKGRWMRPRGLVKRAAAVTAGLVGLNSIAVKAVLEEGGAPENREPIPGLASETEGE